ncbi:MAG TPA: hypothetical protein VMX38_02320 [Verrucomicrobiae bacterium]|jgi:hypothetical protein|nr:hypothetical protein [Verrucomicrobiae bacterium]
MPLRATDHITSRLRDTNSRLGFWLDAIAVDTSRSQRSPISPQQMAALLSELMQAGAWIRSLPNGSQAANPELAEQLRQYRQRVECLRDLLPLIHERLLQEKARLEQERKRIESASEWVHRSRETL